MADIPTTIEWCRRLGFDADYSPPGFAVLWRITRGMSPQDYAQAGFDVTDPNGCVLVFAQPSGPRN